MQWSIVFLLLAIPGTALLFGCAAAGTWLQDHPNRWAFTLAAGAFVLLSGYLVPIWRRAIQTRPVQAG